MHTALILFATFSTIFATIVMSYISLAVPIGPWIEPTIALIGLLGMRWCARSMSIAQQSHTVTLATIAGGIGGIIASACAWTVPALHFLQPELFQQWLAAPAYFAAIVGAVVLVAGGCGLVVTRWYEKPLLFDETTPFPMGQLVYKTIAVQQSLRKGYELLAGAVGALVFNAVHTCSRLIPSKITMLQPRMLWWWKVPSFVLRLDLIPMLWAIGFVTGHVIAIPFLVGVLTKTVLIEPLHKLFFPAIHSDNFLLAFCSGLVVQGALMSFISLPTSIWKSFKQWWKQKAFPTRGLLSQLLALPELLVVGTATIALLMWFSFTIPAQLFVIVGVILCAYQLIVFMGKAGLAPLGRYATFVMLPGLVMFGFTYVQATLVSACIEISGGVAADSMSGKKLGQLAGIDCRTVHRMQWFALVMCALVIGGVFWLLISHFGLGATTELVAQKAQSRALLIKAYDFDLMALLLGVLFGFVLKHIRVNASLVLGSLLMPLDYSLILIAGGLSTYLVTDKESHYPFWSGVFAASSIWMLVKTLL